MTRLILAVSLVISQRWRKFDEVLFCCCVICCRYGREREIGTNVNGLQMTGKETQSYFCVCEVRGGCVRARCGKWKPAIIQTNILWFLHEAHTHTHPKTKIRNVRALVELVGMRWGIERQKIKCSMLLLLSTKCDTIQCDSSKTCSILWPLD